MGLLRATKSDSNVLSHDIHLNSWCTPLLLHHCLHPTGLLSIH